MTGFPGETDAEFEETLKFVNRIGFADAHIFQYSQRRGTPAARRSDQVMPEIKEARSKLIIEATNKSRDAFLLSQIGKVTEVLFETSDNGVFEGKTDNYITVHARYTSDICGEFKTVLLEKAENGIMFGKIVD
jgi:threonylcarbamoyladenosine tRNA methylthiotransferase MtaB